MRNDQLASLVLVFAVTAAAGQTSKEPSPPPTTSGTTKGVTLVGCIDGGGAGDELTFADTKHKKTYRLTGADMREYVGRRVQIIGTSDSRRLHIAGGLLPAPNVAAQAGAIDPGQAAIATASAGVGTNPTSRARLPEFRVESLRRLYGPCPKQ